MRPQSPYVDRLSRLTRLIPAEFTALQVVYTARSAREKIALLERLRREQKEGIVLKNLTAAYSPGKTSGSNDHLKYKFVESASFVVTLVHPTKRSVSLGLYAGSEIVDAGNVTIPPNHDIPSGAASWRCVTSTPSARAGPSTSPATWASARTSSPRSAGSAS